MSRTIALACRTCMRTSLHRYSVGASYYCCCVPLSLFAFIEALGTFFFSQFVTDSRSFRSCQSLKPLLLRALTIARRVRAYKPGSPSHPVLSGLRGRLIYRLFRDAIPSPPLPRVRFFWCCHCLTAFASPAPVEASPFSGKFLWVHSWRGTCWTRAAACFVRRHTSH